MVSYGISINLVEVTWKGRLKQQFPNPNDYSSFMGDFSSATGVTLVCMTSCWNSVHVSLLRVCVRICSPSAKSVSRGIHNGSLQLSRYMEQSLRSVLQNDTYAPSPLDWS